MRLPRSVLDLVRGAGGAAVVLAVGCSTQSAPIHREPAARLVPAAQVAPPPPVVVAAPLPTLPVPSPTAPSAVLSPAPTPPTAPPVAPPETAADRRNRRRAAAAREHPRCGAAAGRSLRRHRRRTQRRGHRRRQHPRELRSRLSTFSRLARSRAAEVRTMRLPRTVLDVVRGASGAALALAVGCSSQGGSITREPVARLIPAPGALVQVAHPDVVTPPTAVLVPTPPTPPTVALATPPPRPHRPRHPHAVPNIAHGDPLAQPDPNALPINIRDYPAVACGRG